MTSIYVSTPTKLNAEFHAKFFLTNQDWVINSTRDLFAKYQPPLKLDDHIKFFRQIDIVDLGKAILLLLPLRNIAQSVQVTALLTFLTNEKAESKHYEQFWKSCGVSPADTTHYAQKLAVLEEIDKDGEFAKECLATQMPSTSQSQTNLQFVAALIKETVELFEPVWTAIHEQLKKEIEYKNQEAREIFEQKRKFNRLARQNKLSQEDLEHDNFENLNIYNYYAYQIKSLQNQMYKSIPQIKRLCMRLDLTIPGNSRQIERLQLIARNLLEQVNKITYDLLEKLVQDEAITAVHYGISARTVAAKRFQNRLFENIRTAENNFFQGLYFGVDSLLGSLDPKSLNSHSNSKDFMNKVIAIYKGNDSKTLASLDVFNSFYAECHKNKKELDQKLKALEFNLKLKWFNYLGYLESFPYSIESTSVSEFLNTFKVWLESQFRSRPNFQEEWIDRYAKLKENQSRSHEHRTEMVTEIVGMGKKVQHIKNSVNLLFMRIFPALFALRTVDAELKEKTAFLQFDSFLHALKFEEEDAFSKQMAAKAALNQPAGQISPQASPTDNCQDLVFAPRTPLSALRQPPDLLYVRSSAAKRVFDLQHYLKLWHEMNADQLFQPGCIAHDSSHFVQARHQQIYSLNCLANVLNLLEQARAPHQRATLVQFACLFGHLSIEQGLTDRYLQSHPNGFLSHSLKELLADLGIAANHNPWVEEVDTGTLIHRYAWNMNGDANFALRHIFANHVKTTDEFCEKQSKWVKAIASLSLQVISSDCPAYKSDLLERIHSILKAFHENPVASSSGDGKMGEESGEKLKAMSECEEKLKETLSIVDTQIKAANNPIPNLRNARNHLSNFLAVMSLFRQHPQQFFLHIHLQMMLISAQYFAENLGIHLSGWINHSLYSYGLEEGLKGIDEETLKWMNVEKGGEYPFHYFAHNRRPSPLMKL